MIRWTLQSNAADVLSLGPRAAGLLLQVGIRTVEQLLTAEPLALEQRLKKENISAEIIQSWQCEAQLILVAPELPSEAVQIFAAVRISSLEKIALSVPTELLMAIEILAQEKNGETNFQKISPPSVALLSSWIRSAQELLDQKAA